MMGGTAPHHPPQRASPLEPKIGVYGRKPLVGMQGAKPPHCALAQSADTRNMTDILTPAGLESALRAIGAERYHDKHPFHRLLHTGRLDKGQVQAWALNR